MKNRIALITAIGLLLTGCVSTPTSVAESPTPAPKATYATVVELRDAYMKAGGACPDWQPNNVVKLAAQSGACDANTVLSTYLSSDIRDQVVTTLKGFGGGVHLLVGENWVINTLDPESYVSELGGTVVSG